MCVIMRIISSLRSDNGRSEAGGTCRTWRSKADRQGLLIDTDDGTEVYDESGYTEESYGADDYADSSAGEYDRTGQEAYKLDLSTWYGKAIVIASCCSDRDTFDNSFGGSCSFFDNFWYQFCI